MSDTNDVRDDEGHSLTQQLVQKHLGTLGIHPFTLTFVFTTASLSKLELTDLDVIIEYPYLQHVICADNHLRSLAPLRGLNTLLSVNASHNQLNQVLDFDIPKCTSENAWVDGEQWIGSLLRHADLSFNCITSVRNLQHAHPFLIELHLAHNGIRDIEGISGLRYLRVLDLSYNHISSSNGLDSTLTALTTLHLRHNQITNIDQVAVLPRLTDLDVAHNKIQHLGCLEQSTALQRLDLSSNAIASVRELDALRPLRFLSVLQLHGCPLIEQEESAWFYRTRVLRRLQQLTRLDQDEVSAKEKIKALVAHGSDITSRQQVQARYLPSQAFINYLPPLESEEDAARPAVDERSTC